MNNGNGKVIGNGKLGFGDFKLDPAKHVVWHNDEPVDLPLKAVDLLSLLVERRGDVVTKDEIWKHVWNDAFIEETNLTHNIYLLRKTFREHGVDGLIKTVPRRGYRFTGDVSVESGNGFIYERTTITDTIIEETTVPDPASSLARNTKIALAGAAVLLTSIVAIVVWYRAGTPTEPAKVSSVAVLPLKSFGSAGEDEELRLRITDALITRLGSLQNISVSPTNSIIRFSGIDTDPIDAGRKLEVDAVLEGRLQREGDRLRVTLQLISIRSGGQIWSRQFDGRVGETLNLQDAIAAALVPNINSEMSLAKNPTANAEAYENYLKGRYLWNKRHTKELEKSAAYFEQAIALDPNFALAHAGLADAYSQLANDGPRPDVETYERAKAIARHALEIDPNLSEGYSALGWIAYIFEWNWAEAERAFARAIELNPNNAEAHHWRALNFRALGKTEEFFSEMETARRLAPLTKPIGLNFYQVVKGKEGCARAYEYMEKLITLHEMSVNERTELLGFHHTLCGNHDNAVSVLANVPKETLGLKSRAFLGVAYARLGGQQEAIGVLSDLGNANSTAKFYLRPYVYVALGDFDSAFADLEQGVAARDNRLIRLGTDEFLAPLRTDPRFKQLLAKMNLPQ